MKSLGTIVDLSLRNSRGRPASEFTLPPGFLEAVRETCQWARFFVPSLRRVL